MSQPRSGGRLKPWAQAHGDEVSKRTSPAGATEIVAQFFRPYGAVNELRIASRGYRPWLYSVAATRLRQVRNIIGSITV
jgi:hypothetical protein